jgi:hypothetical protein
LAHLAERRFDEVCPLEDAELFLLLGGQGFAHSSSCSANLDRRTVAVSQNELDGLLPGGLLCVRTIPRAAGLASELGELVEEIVFGRGERPREARAYPTSARHVSAAFDVPHFDAAEDSAVFVDGAG